MDWHIDTRCVQAGYSPQSGEPRVTPIVQSTTYKYDSAETMGDLFDLKTDGFFYTRLGNPTAAAAEGKIAALEGGIGALLTASGQAAVTLAVLNIAGAGDHIVSGAAVYGGTYNLFDKTLRGLGIDVTFIGPDATVEEINASFRPNTKLLFGEMVANPSLRVLDLAAYAAAAHAHGVPLIVDNTFPTPIFCRPFEWGADIVVHSTSKYLDGHAVALGGAVVDGGKFDWDAHTSRYPGLTAPDESYHGVVYTQQFGCAAYIAKCRAHLMRDMGPAPAPFNAFLLNLGMETLHLRMPRHAENAQKVAEFLQAHPRVAWVSFPGLSSHPDYALTQKYLPQGSCGVVSFGVKGGREAACAVLNRLKLAAIVTHVADLRTCAIHPASTTHRQMNDEQLAAGGVSPDLIRLSVGLEYAGDILADLEQALG
ncbi:MAG: O-acetylhomoserine aminocarboxypropyltransferase/cysteine synthase [Oscillospiraceae bacterium]|nr:O-acetylhomoserine aminocarboxypropyltransferase/cysteine synthase [Oscillospiraceae bacterium]